MKLEDKIKQLEQEFEAKIKDLKEEAQQEQGFFPEIGEYYFYINDAGDIYRTEYAPPYNDDDYECRESIGNIFKNRGEACFAVEKLKVEEELRKFSRPFEYGKFNYYLFFDIDGNNLKIDFTSYCQPQGAIYFESGEEAQQAIKSVGEDRIKKYIFEVGEY